MNKSIVEFKMMRAYWINDSDDDQNDRCSHGRVSIIINDKVVVEDFGCTTSAAGLNLLRSIDSDYLISNSTNQLFPCCGNFMYPDDSGSRISIWGCSVGIEMELIHENQHVCIRIQDNEIYEIDEEIFKNAVYEFVDSVEEYYQKSSPKKCSNEFDNNNWNLFWSEWNIRKEMLKRDLQDCS